MLNTDYRFSEVYSLAAQIEAGTDKVHFKPVFSTDHGGVVLAAFKAGQKLDTHVAPAELMVNVLEGEIEFSVLGHHHRLQAGQFMLVGSGVEHSVAATTDAKLMLVKIK